MRKMTAWTLGSVMAILAGCGGSGSDLGGSVTTDNSGARGSLQINPPLRVASLSAVDFTSQLNASATGQGLLAAAGGTLKCGVNFHYIKYGTVGGASEATNATGALMVPTGTDPACTGPRPVVLYAHGTTTSKGYNLANVVDQTNDAYSESILVAANFAAQGFIVVAPNYAGYDASTLPYHPYLNSDQESKEMIDALTAARKAFGNVGANDSGKLFITGYSQGGHVAMATHKAMQALSMTVTASAPMSGPYAMAAFGDAIFSGQVNLGGTVFAPLLATSYQKAYGNIYTNLTDLYSSTYATGIDTLLPSALSETELFTQGKLPQTALFSSTPPTAPSVPGLQTILNGMTPPTSPAAQAPLFALGFGTSYLINNNARLNYLLDAIQNPDGAVPTATTGLPASSPGNAMRIALKTNDLRGWQPARPILLCGGNGDPTVFYSVNTGLMQMLWSLQVTAGLVTVLDVDSNPTGVNDPYAAAKLGFATFKQQTAAAGGASAVIQNYHGGLVPPFCTAAARGFFQQVLSLNL
jgi:alpha/beta superfamily hydrolase